VIVDIVTSVCFTNLLDFSQIFVHLFGMKWPTQKDAELDIIFVQLALVWIIIQFLYIQIYLLQLTCGCLISMVIIPW